MVHKAQLETPNEGIMSNDVLSKASSFIGQSLSGKYKLLRIVGHGGMGVVYEGYDESLERAIAVKMILGEIGDSEEKRFEREAKAVAKLKHPGIVTIYEFGVHQRKYPYIVMELVKGTSLGDIIDKDRGLAHEKATELLLQVCDAIAHAHEHKVIHRDLKPSNILIEDTGRVVVLDFGLAKVVSGDDEFTKLTATWAVMGTPLYMSPEQCMGDTKSADARSDIYSLGCIAYQLLTGKAPINGDNVLQICNNHIRKSPALFNSHGITVPASLETLVFQCLSKEPEDRPESVAKISKLLRAVIVDESNERYGLQPNEYARSNQVSIPDLQPERSLLEAAEQGHADSQYYVDVTAKEKATDSASTPRLQNGNVSDRYSAQITRSNPSMLLFLLDQSGSMADSFGSGEASPTKADALAYAINRSLFELTLKCAKDEGVRDYYVIGILGYGAQVGPAFAGSLAGRELVPISELGNMPARLEDRTKRVSDGAGGLVDETIKFPIWVEPVASGGRPMSQALNRAKSIISNWVHEHSNAFPPVIINIASGDSTDGDPTRLAQSITNISTTDGSVLLFNVLLCPSACPAIEFPSKLSDLPDNLAKLFFSISSPLPDFMKVQLETEGICSEGVRGLILNGSIDTIISLITSLFDTRPVNFALV